jgi:hypothetical protein
MSTAYWLILLVLLTLGASAIPQTATNRSEPAPATINKDNKTTSNSTVDWCCQAGLSCCVPNK